MPIWFFFYVIYLEQVIYNTGPYLRVKWEGKKEEGGDGQVQLIKNSW